MSYIIVEVDGPIRSIIDKMGRANKYGEPKLFESQEKAARWIQHHTYKGMTGKYEIQEVKR